MRGVSRSLGDDMPVAACRRLPPQVLKAAQAEGVEKRSVVMRRLHAESKSWGESILERKHRSAAGLSFVKCSQTTVYACLLSTYFRRASAWGRNETNQSSRGREGRGERASAPS